MTKKNVIEMVTANKARMNETSKHYEMSQNDFDTMLENLPDELKIVKSKNQENMYCVASKDGKSRYVIIDIVKTKKVKTKKENDEVGKAGHKAKGNSYIILLKKKDEKYCIFIFCIVFVFFLLGKTDHGSFKRSIKGNGSRRGDAL